MSRPRSSASVDAGSGGLLEIRRKVSARLAQNATRLPSTVPRGAAPAQGERHDSQLRHCYRLLARAFRVASRSASGRGSSAGERAAADVQLREAGAVFARRHAGVAFEQAAKEGDVLIADLGA